MQQSELMKRLEPWRQLSESISESPIMSQFRSLREQLGYNNSLFRQKTPLTLVNLPERGAALPRLVSAELHPVDPKSLALFPPDIVESRTYFTNLITQLKTLPPRDIITVLDYQLRQQDGDLGLYVERLAYYVANSAGLEPHCWQMVSNWLKDAGGAAPAPLWGGSMASDAPANGWSATESPTSPVTPGLSLRQVALLFIYNGEPLNRPKANHEATKAGFTSPTSGQKLMQYYNALAHHVTNRIGVEKKALSDMIKDITAVLPALVGTSRQHAESELKTLEAKR